MTETNAGQTLATLRGVRNTRAFAPEPLPDGALDAILEVARRTGSAGNQQPWEVVVVQDRDRIAALAGLGPNLGWMARAPVAIALVMAGEKPKLEGFDEGRLAERILVAANALGLGAGIGWPFGTEALANARRLLAVPEPQTLRTLIAIGRPGGPPPERPDSMPHRPPDRARKPLADLVHHDRYGARQG